MIPNAILTLLHWLPVSFLAACCTVGLILFLRPLWRRLGRRSPFAAFVSQLGSYLPLVGRVLSNSFRRVPVDEINGEDSESSQDGANMQRVLGWPMLTVMGIAAIIGTGIFVLPGQAAALYAGPAVILSFALCFVLCLIVGLCYAEFASMIRSSGSAYMYAYATLGEGPAWVIGWDLLLEYAFGASAVAVGWSAYYESISGDLFGSGNCAGGSDLAWCLAYAGIAVAIALTLYVSRVILPKLSAPLAKTQAGLKRSWRRLAPAWAQSACDRVERAWVSHAPAWFKAVVAQVFALVGWSRQALLEAAPYLVGFVGVGLAGIPERFTHAPKDVPIAVLGIAGPIIVGLLFARLRYASRFEGSTQPLQRLIKALLHWAPLAAGMISIGFLPSIDLPAVLVTLAVSQLLVRGIHHTAHASTVFVVIKLAVIIVFVALGLSHIDPANWHPFVPERTWLIPDNGGAHWAYGWQGVLTGASIVLFAFLGFDGVTTAAGECRRPQRDVPIGIMLSLLVCTIAYMAMAIVMTGCLHYSQLAGDETTGAAPIALIMKHIGLARYSWLISFGALAGITSALIVSLYGQSRVQFSMAKRGLVPPALGALHPKYGTPATAIQLWGWIAAVVAGVFTISELSELTNIGTLAAFVLVMVGICVLRYKEPKRERPFRCPSILATVLTFFARHILRWKGATCPWLPDLPLLGCIGCLAFMWALPTITKWRFVGWMVIGFVVYYFYSYSHSKLAKRPPNA